MAKEYINEYMELRRYGNLETRESELFRIMGILEHDRYADWCCEDDKIETLRHNALLAVRNYQRAISQQRDELKEVFYDKLDFADDNMKKPKKKGFWSIFG